MHTVAIGNRAEQAAAEYLERLRYGIVDRNWRQRRCEIDIVAIKNQTVYFVEVKYRRRSYAGAGLDYVTNQKVRQMAFAASMWVVYHHWNGAHQLSAIAVSGPDYDITDFVASIY